MALSSVALSPLPGSIGCIPFYLHILLEIPASLNFFFKPSQQLGLSSPAPGAEAVVRQYAVLLLASSVLALIFALRPIDTASKRVAGALGIYHLAPLTRAVGRIWAGEIALSSGLGGPWVHAAVHGYTLLCLWLLFFTKTATTERAARRD
ncbi:hypothetical protein PVAG01_05927 [Phlyctema vagabunda]|uniref:Uncharacterized protein n=1 Tax=Phlyctema vagabunda TaxID=108571 RepID=A0ABR4PEM0_9HELO